jgi:hypothetical protein
MGAKAISALEGYNGLIIYAPNALIRVDENDSKDGIEFKFYN